jgi:hypothetical protein
MMLRCNLVIPGFAKSGTSSLHLYLAMHPDICMSEPKEPHFFAFSDSWQRGFEWYNSIFQNDGWSRRWYGESSTSYSVWEPALEKIKHWLYQPRFIILLRHPVERLFSHYNWLAAMNFESRSLLKAVREEEEKGYHPDSPLPGGNFANYRRASHYSRFCPILERLFGKENILYLNSDLLFKDPGEALDKCFRFLSLKELVVSQAIRANATNEKLVQRTFGLSLLLKPFPRAFVDRLDSHARFRRWAKQKLGKKKIRPPVITASDKDEIARMLKEDISFYQSVFQ